MARRHYSPSNPTFWQLQPITTHRLRLADSTPRDIVRVYSQEDTQRLALSVLIIQRHPANINPSKRGTAKVVAHRKAECIGTIRPNVESSRTLLVGIRIREDILGRRRKNEHRNKAIAPIYPYRQRTHRLQTARSKEHKSTGSDLVDEFDSAHTHYPIYMKTSGCLNPSWQSIVMGNRYEIDFWLATSSPATDCLGLLNSATLGEVSVVYIIERGNHLSAY